MITWTKAEKFATDICRNVPVLDTGARNSTITFVQRNIGDVFLSWENEAFLAIRELGKDRLEIVIPSVSILAEPPVAVVDKVVDKKGTRAIAEDYLRFLYSADGQAIAGRPRDASATAKYADFFPSLNLITIDEVFGGWAAAQKNTSTTAESSIAYTAPRGDSTVAGAISTARTISARRTPPAAPRSRLSMPPGSLFASRRSCTEPTLRSRLLSRTKRSNAGCWPKASESPCASGARAYSRAIRQRSDGVGPFLTAANQPKSRFPPRF